MELKYNFKLFSKLLKMFEKITFPCSSENFGDSKKWVNYSFGAFSFSISSSFSNTSSERVGFV